jgi:ABC-type multidrug transport system permease subunit
MSLSRLIDTNRTRQQLWIDVVVRTCFVILYFASGVIIIGALTGISVGWWPRLFLYLALSNTIIDHLVITVRTLFFLTEESDDSV